MIDILEQLPGPAQKLYRKIIKKSNSGEYFKPLRHELAACRQLLSADLLERVGDMYVIPESCQIAAKRANTYLIRKFEIKTNHFAPHMPPRFPSGSKRFECVDPETGELITVLAFPNDEVSELLSRHNCNRLNPPIRLLKDENDCWHFEKDVSF